LDPAFERGGKGKKKGEKVSVPQKSLEAGWFNPRGRGGGGFDLANAPTEKGGEGI